MVSVINILVIIISVLLFMVEKHDILSWIFNLFAIILATIINILRLYKIPFIERNLYIIVYVYTWIYLIYLFNTNETGITATIVVLDSVSD